MKKIFLLFFCLHTLATGFSQGITLLYKGGSNGGWNDPANWIQTNALAGQAPIQRAPTKLDDVVFSKSMSGLSGAGFSLNFPDSLGIGGFRDGGYRCRSMRISGMEVNFTYNTLLDYSPMLHVFTSNGGQLRIDSGGNISRGLLSLHGGNADVYDLEILDSKYGDLFTHAEWSSVTMMPKGRAKFVNSHCEGWGFNSHTTGGELYAENCTFKTPRFVMGDSAKATILDCRISDGNNFVTHSFGIGRGANFTSRNVDISALICLNFYTSGSVFTGNLTTNGGQCGLSLGQKDPANPLPNIIDGHLKIFGKGVNITGSLKLSGDLINSAHELDMYPDSSHVFINNQHIFKIGGISNYGNGVSLDGCTQPGCHFKVEFFGDGNSHVVWPVGFPVDTLVINKSNCAKVTFANSLYVSGQTNIESGQLSLSPNDTIAYKFVNAGDLNIFQGGGLFLRRNAAGAVANMAVGGAINDYNISTDTTCAGLSNPYSGNIGLYKGLQGQPKMPVVINSSTPVDNLTLHGEAGTDFFLQNDLSVKKLRFADSTKLFLGNRSITITDSILNFGPASFIVTDGPGKLQRKNIGSRETVFPIGPTASSYNPLAITNTGTSDDFTVRVEPKVYTNGTSGTTVSERVVNRSWLVEEKTPGGSQATLKLQWNAGDELTGFNRTAAYISHFTAGKWDDNGPAAAQGSNPYTITRSSLSSFSPFTVFSSVVNSVSAPVERPLQLFPNPAQQFLYVQLPNRLAASTLRVFNSKGTLVKTMQARAGSTMATLRIADLPAGIYIVVIKAGQWSGSSSFLKQ